MIVSFRVREAASGRECLESVHDKPPDAVLLDISMDDMDGWETLRQLRTHGFHDLPVIMVSANAFEENFATIPRRDHGGIVRALDGDGHCARRRAPIPIRCRDSEGFRCRLALGQGLRQRVVERVVPGAGGGIHGEVAVGALRGTAPAEHIA